MEIKIPREVRNYHETIFFGLSLRQFLCSAVAIAVAVIAYFSFNDTLGNEGVSWICILFAFPIASLGFVTYHGMPLEHFIVAYFRSEFLIPNEVVFKADNDLFIAYQQLRQEEKNKRKGLIHLCQTLLKHLIKLKKQD